MTATAWDCLIATPELKRDAVRTVLDASAPVALRAPRRWWALGAVFLTILCVGVDSTVLSVALPTLAEGAQGIRSRPAVVLVGLASSSWPRRCCRPDSLGDRYGRKRVFLVSLGLFADWFGGVRLLDVGG